IVSLGKGVQPAVEIGKAQEPHRASQEEDQAKADKKHGQEIGESYHSSFSSGSPAPSALVDLTKATAAKAASRASTRPTSMIAPLPPAAARSSVMATPPVPTSWALA